MCFEPTDEHSLTIVPYVQMIFREKKNAPKRNSSVPARISVFARCL